MDLDVIRAPNPQVACGAEARSRFPSLTTDPAVVYLDSASTTQSPQKVLDAVTKHLHDPAANPGRGGYPWATRAAGVVETVRAQVAGFLGAQAADEIVFTAGATAAMNAVTQSWGLANLRDGDEILYGLHDHASSVHPWVDLQRTLARAGVHISLIPYDVNRSGEADTAEILERLSSRTRAIVASHVHGVFGARSTLRELRGVVGPSVLLVFDCSQSVGHIPVDVDDLAADFVVFSGHKMFGLPGVGVLYCRRRLHAQLSPFLPGGGEGVALGVDGTGQLELRSTGLPSSLESGTANLPGIVALGAAIDFLDEVGLERIASHVTDLTLRLVEGLQTMLRVDLLPGVAWAGCRVGYGIVSFRVDGERADDVGFALSSRGYYVRTGRHCLASEQLGASVRVSLHAYTTATEVDGFLATLYDLLDEGA